MTGMPNIDAYSSARRISSAVATGRPSSVIATQPAARRSPISVSCSPFEPIDTAPIGYTRASAASAARFTMNSRHRRVVVDRIGVRHARDGREAAGDGRRRAGRDRLLVLLPRLAQVHVHVDEPGRHDAATPAARRRARRRPGRFAADARDAAAVDQDVEARRSGRPPGRRRARPSGAASSTASSSLPHRPAGTAPPSARRRRWRPGRGSPTTGRRRRPSRSRRRGSSGPGA